MEGALGVLLLLMVRVLAGSCLAGVLEAILERVWISMLGCRVDVLENLFAEGGWRICWEQGVFEKRSFFGLWFQWIFI